MGMSEVELTSMKIIEAGYFICRVTKPNVSNLIVSPTDN